MPFKVLIAEDDLAVAQVVAFGARMTWPGCQVTIAATGRQALQQFADEQPDLVILDVAMPPPDGLEVCQRIREVSAVPILILTARGSTLDKVRALDLGADDYVTKPFDHLELLARLRALVRRTQPTQPPPSSLLTVRDLSLDTATHEVLVQGQVVHLTSTEYRLLEELMRHAGRVLPSHYLLQQVWGPEYTGEDHYLKVFVRRLRRKLGDDAAHPRYIHTEWNIGYRFVPPY